MLIIYKKKIMNNVVLLKLYLKFHWPIIFIGGVIFIFIFIYLFIFQRWGVHKTLNGKIG